MLQTPERVRDRAWVPLAVLAAALAAGAVLAYVGHQRLYHPNPPAAPAARSAPVPGGGPARPASAPLPLR